LLRRALRTQFGDLRDRLVVANRAIGGTTWDDAAGVPSSTTVTSTRSWSRVTASSTTHHHLNRWMPSTLCHFP
jgi:hypothetical protein